MTTTPQTTPLPSNAAGHASQPHPTTNGSPKKSTPLPPKRVLPSRARRGGPGVGSCEADVMILDTLRRRRMSPHSCFLLAELIDRSRERAPYPRNHQLPAHHQLGPRPLHLRRALFRGRDQHARVWPLLRQARSSSGVPRAATYSDPRVHAAGRGCQRRRAFPATSGRRCPSLLPLSRMSYTDSQRFVFPLLTDRSPQTRPTRPTRSATANTRRSRSGNVSARRRSSSTNSTNLRSASTSSAGWTRPRS